MTFANRGPASGSLDGDGAGDCDVPYRFGWRPRTSATFPFTTRQFARLLIMRSRVAVGALADDRSARPIHMEGQRSWHTC